MQRIVKHRQTIFDISIQELGSVEGSFDLSVINDYPITASPPVGKNMTIDSIRVLNQGVVNYYGNNKTFPATNIENTTGANVIGQFKVGSFTIKK